MSVLKARCQDRDKALLELEYIFFYFLRPFVIEIMSYPAFCMSFEK